VKGTTPNWAVLRECGQEPLQFYCFLAAAKFFNSLLAGIVACSRGLCMQILLSASYRKCWTADFVEACEGLCESDRYTNYVKAAIPLPILVEKW